MARYVKENHAEVEEKIFDWLDSSTKMVVIANLRKRSVTVYELPIRHHRSRRRRDPQRQECRARLPGPATRDLRVAVAPCATNVVAGKMSGKRVGTGSREVFGEGYPGGCCA